MSASLAERRWEGTAAAVVTVLVLLLTGCSPFGGEEDVEPGLRSSQSVEEQVDELLDRRARAVRTGRVAGFLEDVDRSRRAFLRWQRTYFGNLRELPLRTFRYDVHPDSVVVLDDGTVQAVVAVSLQLRGYDAVPVVTSNLFTFSIREDDSLALLSDRDEDYERKHDVQLQPWDQLDVEVVEEADEGASVLGVFDTRSIDAAYQIMPTVVAAMAAVDAEVPLPWSPEAVVYALSDIRVMANLNGLPGGDPDNLDGVAFAVQAVTGMPRIASTRMLLHPRMIFRTDDVRERLVRHELTHVALGTRDDQVPKWLSEGLAEYVSVQPVPLVERLISRDAVKAARRGIRSLPSDEEFNLGHSGANYGIAWFACEYIVRVFGEDALWGLFDAMRARGGSSAGVQDRVLQKELGLTSGQLAAFAGQEILQTFG
jgi:hypothetical protein